MHTGRTVFSQLMDFVPRHEFRSIVERHQANHYLKRFSCWDQFLCMTFAQLTYRESLRDIATCLQSLGPTLYHSGIRARVSKSTLADANERRPWKVYQDLAMTLIARARILYRNDQILNDLDGAVYALDSTIIELCLKLFPWAKAANHLKTSAGVKLHALLELRSELPVFATVSEANVNDIRVLQQLTFEPGAFYVLDRGYTTFAQLRRIDTAKAFFVIRAKRRLRFKRLYSHARSTTGNIRVDQSIVFKVPKSREEYPDHLRRIKVFDNVNNKMLVFLTNNFDLEASTIGELYRLRWKIELFFRWIKQHLRIKAFYGTTPNAVCTQIWIALCVFVLVAIVKKELGLPHSLYTILQILSITLFEKVPINQILTPDNVTLEHQQDEYQLLLFNY